MCSLEVHLAAPPLVLPAELKLERFLDLLGLLVLAVQWLTLRVPLGLPLRLLLPLPLHLLLLLWLPLRLSLRLPLRPCDCQ